uniref:Uncharacterized protein n=1 Tax=Sphaerodactylus townsendi TaxID=933632 RepID=A0ACB8G6K0_9SAUR
MGPKAEMEFQDSMSDYGADDPGYGGEQPWGQGSGLEQGTPGAFPGSQEGWTELLKSFMLTQQAMLNFLTTQHRSKGEKSCPKRGGEKPVARMRSYSGVNSICSEMGERGNRQQEQKTASEETACKCSDGPRKAAAESARMSSMGVIQQQGIVGIKDIIPKKQELWVESMRSEPVILGQSIQVHGTIDTRSHRSKVFNRPV